MRTSYMKLILLAVSFISLIALACDISTLVMNNPGKPNVVIQAPISGSQFREGEEIAVQSIAADPGGIVRVELSVDGNTVSTDLPPIASGQTSFTLIQKWRATAGAHTLGVRAFNAAGVGSDPVIVNVTVAASSAPQVATATIIAQQASPTTLTATLPASPAGTTAAPTTRPTVRPPPTATTASAPPGVYAVSIRMDPTTAKSNQSPAFFVTFLNTTGEVKSYRWRIKIFRPDERNSFGDTAPLQSDIPVGTREIGAVANWKTISLDCQPYVARVFWIDPDNPNNAIEFVKPDRSGGPSVGFNVCP